VLTLRPLRLGEDDAVRSLFRGTLGPGGTSLAFEPPAFDRYTDLCLDWYLGPGRVHARVLDDGHKLVAYTLVCTDAAAYRRWSVPRSLAFAAVALGKTASRPRDESAATFVRMRIRDGWDLRRAPSPMPVHAHMNLDASVRGTSAALVLIDHIDGVCRSVGAPGWYGEVNARVGRRSRGLERIVGPVVHRAPNHTYTWLAGTPVERLTVVRRVSPLAAPPAHSPGPAAAVTPDGGGWPIT